MVTPPPSSLPPGLIPFPCSPPHTPVLVSSLVPHMTSLLISDPHNSAPLCHPSLYITSRFPCPHIMSCLFCPLRPVSSAPHSRSAPHVASRVSTYRPPLPTTPPPATSLPVSPGTFPPPLIPVTSRHSSPQTPRHIPSSLLSPPRPVRLHVQCLNTSVTRHHVRSRKLQTPDVRHPHGLTWSSSLTSGCPALSATTRVTCRRLSSLPAQHRKVSGTPHACVPGPSAKAEPGPSQPAVPDLFPGPQESQGPVQAGPPQPPSNGGKGHVGRGHAPVRGRRRPRPAAPQRRRPSGGRGRAHLPHRGRPQTGLHPRRTSAACGP
ncbi:uncharacterized protein LOC133761962 [Lepus europaeus]|uniref:uncharacterized protein LOC133761962 n=1 Tax=Lepus europaeus TaxID=9983 RepID=UPI002B45BB82|nr:uncharacterized protein LOC133761962 [Lepus europaeus]